MSIDKDKAKNFDRLYAIAHKQAVFMIGGQVAFRVIGSTFRKALVAQEILQIADAQDDLALPETVVALVRELRTRMNDDASLLAD